jgi:anti-anti-sigma factor
MAVVPEPPDVDALRRGMAGVDVQRGQVGHDSVRVALVGEHDLATSEAVRVALAPLCGNVLVDLGQCFFVDSTIIAILLRKAAELGREGHELELRVTAGSIVARTLAITGVERFVSVREAI